MTDRAVELREVRIVGLPLATQAQAQEQHAELMREFALLDIMGPSARPGEAVPGRLLQLIADLSQRYGDIGGASELERQAAENRGDLTVDLVYQAPVEVGADCLRLMELLDEADDFCRAGDRLLTLAAEPELVTFRHWYLGEFARQLDGGAPVSWADYLAAFTPAPVDETLAEIDRLADVLSVAASIAGELDLDRVLQAVTDGATALSGAQFGAFFYNALDSVGEAYVLYVLSGVPREAFADYPVPRKTALFGPTFAGDPPLRLDDVLLDERYGANDPFHGMPPGHLPVRSYLAVPVVAGTNQVLGGLFFGHAEPGVFTPRHERLVVAVAAQAAVAIQNSRLFAAERDARAAAEEAAERLERLQTITARLSQASSLDEVADVVVSTTAAGVGADGAMLATLSRDGARLHVLAALGYDPDVVKSFAEMAMSSQVPATESVRTRSIVTWGSLADRDAAFPALAGVPGSAMSGAAVPLIGAGRSLGVAGYTWDGERNFTDDELAFLTVVSQQCAQAIERAQQYDTSLHAARTLQGSLLPATVPVIDGMSVAARYQPVADGSVVGGDFYDVFRRPDGSWGIFIGDVSGKGVRAASLTALVRHTMRALARRNDATDVVLTDLNDAILAEDRDDRFATLIYLDACPDQDGVALRFTVGGHPLPLLRSAAGDVRTVGTPGTAIGLLPAPRLCVDEVRLAPGEMLVLFTDGFTEGRAPSGDFADDLLVEAITRSSATTADELADELTQLLLDFQSGRPRDDMALLVLEAGRASADCRQA